MLILVCSLLCRELTSRWILNRKWHGRISKDASDCASATWLRVPRNCSKNGCTKKCQKRLPVPRSDQTRVPKPSNNPSSPSFLLPCYLHFQHFLQGIHFLTCACICTWQSGEITGSHCHDSERLPHHTSRENVAQV